MEFADQIHIEHLRRKLWHDREFGQVSVMVGAGLSRCADKVSPNALEFPLWAQLATDLYMNLYPRKGNSFTDTSDEKRHAQLTSGSGALRLASEYETMFGRQALDSLIEQSVPDDGYIPGKIHRLLLSLPWSDVFTTNYDTLLERTRPLIYDRKYDLVLTSSDIPGHMKPRIIKLHGSFPSHRPYILTEEDFRTYPQLYAPFVNVVQESIMENALCLLGFSGDDPNFLHWSGWVRDNLGNATPPIYLCGILNLSLPQRRLLERRGIILIDLSPLFPSESHDRYNRGLEWFLLNLLYGKPPTAIKWPEMSVNHIWKPSTGLEIPLGPKPTSKMTETFPPQNVEMTRILDLIEGWKLSRLDYPGWVMAPSKNRDLVWEGTTHWIQTILTASAQLQTPYDLFAIFELLWRLDLVGIPILSLWVPQLTQVVNKYNPFPQEIEHEALIIRGMEKYEELDWEHISEYWVSINIEMLRYARYTQSEAFLNILTRLKPIASYDNESLNQWNYEACLYYLYNSDFENLRHCIKQWAEIPARPIWQAKRASLLGEIGDIEEALRIANEALTNVRSQFQPGNTDYSLLSQEGLIMLLLQRLSNIGYDQNDSRWDVLSRHKCNPHDEFDLLLLKVAHENPLDLAIEKQTRQFDPGKVSYNLSLTSQMPALKLKNSYALFRLIEKSGIPFRIDNARWDKERLGKAARQIIPIFPLWSLNLILRYDDYDSLNSRYTRSYIAAISDDEISQLFTHHYNSTKNLVNNSMSMNLKTVDNITYASRMRLHCEVLSRVCLRIDSARLDSLLQLTLLIYSQHAFRNDNLARSINDLFKRIFSSLSERELVDRIPLLLAAPILDNTLDSGINDSFLYLRISNKNRKNDIPNRQSWSERISSLIEIARSGDSERRKFALIRLDTLYKLNSLTETEVRAFSESLWSRIDAQNSLPSDTGLYYYTYLRLPEPRKGHAKQLLRSYFLNANLPKVVNTITKEDGTLGYSILGLGTSINSLIQSIVFSTKTTTIQDQNSNMFIDWSPEEATILFEKFLAYWDDQKKGLDVVRSMGILFPIDNLRNILELMLPLLLRVICPNIKDIESQNEISRMLDEMRSHFQTERALPGLLFFQHERYEEISGRLSQSLYAGDGDAISAAAWALFDWLSYSKSGELKPPPSDLLEIPFVRLAGRAEIGILTILEYTSQVFVHFPKLIKAKYVKLTYLALEHLLLETQMSDLNSLTQELLPPNIHIAERTEIRVLASALAKSLFDYLVTKKAPIENILNDWKLVSLQDPLPEVRRVWQD